MTQALFTVYQTRDYIILSSGTTDPGWKVVCTCTSHERAQKTADRLCERLKLPLKVFE